MTLDRPAAYLGADRLTRGASVDPEARHVPALVGQGIHPDQRCAPVPCPLAHPNVQCFALTYPYVVTGLCI